MLKPNTNRLQSTLDDLKRRLKQERQEAETMTQNLSQQREHGRMAEDTRVRRLEAELAAAHQELTAHREQVIRLEQQSIADRREAQLRVQRFEEELALLESRLAEEHASAESMARSMRLGEGEAGAGEGYPTFSDYQKLSEDLAASRTRNEELAAERDTLAQRLKDAEAWGRTLEEEESRLRAQLSELAEERDDARSGLQEVEARFKAFEEEFTAAQEISREQREAAREVIQQLEAERDEQRSRLTEIEARAQWLEEELSAARRQLQEAGLPGGEATAPDQKDLYWRLTVPLSLVMVSTDLLAMNSQTSPQMREAVRAIQMESRRMLDSLRARGVNLPVPAPVPAGASAAPQATAQAEQAPATSEHSSDELAA